MVSADKRCADNLKFVSPHRPREPFAQFITGFWHQLSPSTDIYTSFLGALVYESASTDYALSGDRDIVIDGGARSQKAIWLHGGAT